MANLNDKNQIARRRIFPVGNDQFAVATFALVLATTMEIGSDKTWIIFTGSISIYLFEPVGFVVVPPDLGHCSMGCSVFSQVQIWLGICIGSRN